MKQFLLAIIMTLLVLMSIRSWAQVQFPDMSVAYTHFGQASYLRTRVQEEPVIVASVNKRIDHSSRLQDHSKASTTRNRQKTSESTALVKHVAVTDVKETNQKNQAGDGIGENINSQSMVLRYVMQILGKLNAMLAKAGIDKIVDMQDKADMTRDAVDYYQNRFQRRGDQLVQGALVQESYKRVQKKKEQSQQPDNTRYAYPPQYYQYMQQPIMPMPMGYAPTPQPMIMPIYPQQQQTHAITVEQISQLLDQKLASRERHQDQYEDDDFNEEHNIATHVGIDVLREVTADEQVPFAKKERKLYKVINRIVAQKGIGELITKQVQTLLDHEIKIVGCLLAARPAPEIEQAVDERDAALKQSIASSTHLYNVVLDLATYNQQSMRRLNRYTHAGRTLPIKQTKPLRHALNKKERRYFLESMKNTLERYQDFIYSRYIDQSIES